MEVDITLDSPVDIEIDFFSASSYNIPSDTLIIVISPGSESELPIFVKVHSKETVSWMSTISGVCVQDVIWIIG